MVFVDVEIVKNPITLHMSKHNGPTRVKLGIYDDCGFNFENAVADYYSRQPKYEDFFGIPLGKVINIYHCGKGKIDYLNSYGTCDSIEQFLESFGSILENSKDEFVVGFTEVLKSEQSDWGGWRWHKWGPYYGKQKPTQEYLFDEPKIERICQFVILKKLPNEKKE